MKNQILFLLLILGLLLIAGCSGKTATTGSPSLSVPAQGHEDVEETVVVEDESTGEVVEIEVKARNWEFIPDTIEVNLGDKVDMHVGSIEGVHGFRLPEFGIDEKLELNQEVHIEFVANKRGTFSFACSVPCGKGHGGMTRKLIVK